MAKLVLTLDNETQVLNALQNDPALMEAFLKGKEGTVIKEILKDQKLSAAEINKIAENVKENNVMKLYLGANGSIDANELMRTVGGFTTASSRGADLNNRGIASLLDGKIDANDFLTLAGLLSGSNHNNNNNNHKNHLKQLLYCKQFYCNNFERIHNIICSNFFLE